MRTGFRLSSWVGVAAFFLATGVQAQAVLQALGGSPGSKYFGASVDGGEDVNGDGIDDLIVGAASFCTGYYVRVASGISGATIYQIPAGDPSDAFGRVVAMVGDTDLDGFADFAVSAPRSDAAGLDSGAVFLYSGRTGSVLHTLVGSAPGAAFGSALDGAGDFNGDGRHDILASSSPAASTASIVVRSGATGAELFSMTLPELLYGSAHLGTQVTTAGDIDNNGTSEVAFLGADGSSQQKIFVRGSTNLAVDYGGNPLAAVAGGHDLSGDGIPDLAYSSPSEAGHGSVPANAGRVYVWSLDLLQNGAWSPSTGNSYCGASLALVGDVTGDGRADIVAGSPHPDTYWFNCNLPGDAASANKAWLISGTGFSMSGSEIPNAEGGTFGWSVGAAGDFNANGHPDFIIGSPGTGPGIARVYSWTCGSFDTYGAGCPGSGGITPTLTSNGCSTPAGIVNLNLASAAGGSLAIFVFGLQQSNLSLGYGCTALAAPILPLVIGPMPVFPIGATGPAVGYLSLAGKVPAPMPSLALTAQSFILDINTVGGFSATNGILLAIE